jgi:hypothetical protein
MAFFESAMKMFSPFYPPGTGPEAGPGAPMGGPIGGPVGGPPRIDELQARLNSLQKQIDDLSKKK